MKKIIFLTIVFVFLAGSSMCQEIDGISPDKAYELAGETDVDLIDVRTIAEYVYIGHPENAYCLPLLFWNEREVAQARNDDFMEDLAAKFDKKHTLVFICRSGNRSRVAAQMAFRVGYQKVFNVTEGFEGKKDEKGYRTIGGWKNLGLPYTYALDEKYLYR
jgi:rhodanese-related sulfurtransferase